MRIVFKIAFFNTDIASPSIYRKTEVVSLYRTVRNVYVYVRSIINVSLNINTAFRCDTSVSVARYDVVVALTALYDYVLTTANSNTVSLCVIAYAVKNLYIVTLPTDRDTIVYGVNARNVLNQNITATVILHCKKSFIGPGI